MTVVAAQPAAPLGGVVRNLVINAASCVAMFGVGLLLVPVLVGAYGLVEYGLIMAARLFLLEGLMRLFDLGLPDVAARAVARARGGEKRRAREQVAACLTLSALQALLTAGALALLAGPLAGALAGVEGGRHVAAMRDVLLWTAAGLLLQYPGQVFEGILRGRERFDLIRLAEIGFLLSAGAGAVIAVRRDAPFDVIAYIWIALSTLRYAALAAFVTAGDRGPARQRAREREAAQGGGRRRPSRGDHASVLRLALGLWLTRVHMTAANFLPQVIIAKLLGPASLAIYDILNRPTRYLRMALNLMAGVLFPAAARLDGGRHDAHLRQVVVVTCGLLAALFLPPVGALMAFGDRVLAVWIGAEYAHLGPWLAVFLAWVAMMVVSLPGILALSTRPGALRAINRLGFLQLALMLAVGLILTPRMGELAFVLGGTLAAAAVLPSQMGLIRREIGAGWWEVLRHPVRFALAGLVPLAVVPLLPPARPDDPLFLVAALGGWVVLHGLSILLLGLRPADRAALLRLAVGARRGWRRNAAVEP